MAALDEAFVSILRSPQSRAVDSDASSGAARARVEADIRSQLPAGPLSQQTQQAYDALLAERAAASAPPKPRARSFAADALGASRIVEAFRGTEAEIDRVTAEVERVAAARAAAAAAECDAPAAHARLVAAMQPHAPPSLARMRELVDEYAKLRSEALASWTVGLAVAARDLDAELEHLVDERELIRELFVVVSRELADKPDAPSVRAPAPPQVCPICFESQSNVAFAPCGHTLCQTCADKLAPPVAGAGAGASTSEPAAAIAASSGSAVPPTAAALPGAHADVLPYPPRTPDRPSGSRGRGFQRGRSPLYQ
jgi:hypothetical protein